MTLTREEPCEYFTRVQMLESELVRFRVKPAESRLDVVVIHAAEALSAYFAYLRQGGLPADYKPQTMTFLLLRFSAVGNVRTVLGPNVPQDRLPAGDSDRCWQLHEKTLIAPSGRLVTGVDCKPCSDGFEIAMYFDSFGRHIWEFDELWGARRVANVVRRGDSLELRDAASGQVLDSRNPFADLLPSE